jgi:uncharacterized membrane protein
VSGLIHEFGELHRAFVHFPIALIVTAAAAEALYMARRSQWLGDAARFMIAAGAWMAVPAVAAGFAEAWGRTFAGEAARQFSVHWVCGVVTAGLAFLAYGTGEGSRRSGQVWEQALYRIFLLASAAGALVTGAFGGSLDDAEQAVETGAVEFGLTVVAHFWY